MNSGVTCGVTHGLVYLLFEIFQKLSPHKRFCTGCKIFYGKTSCVDFFINSTILKPNKTPSAD